MNALPSYWIPTYVYAETWSSIITGCLSICHTRRNCLLSAAGTLRHLATIFMAVCLASWHPDWHPGKLLLRGVSIYTANKLNFSFMTPTTVCPVCRWMNAGPTSPDNCVAIVKSLPGDGTLPASASACESCFSTCHSPRRTDVYIWLVISQRRPRRWHQLQVGSTWPAEKSLPPPPTLSVDVSCLIWRFVVVAMPWNPLGVFQMKVGGLKAHSLFVSWKISSWV